MIDRVALAPNTSAGPISLRCFGFAEAFLLFPGLEEKQGAGEGVKGPEAV
jgi:hypothetical protein